MGAVLCWVERPIQPEVRQPVGKFDVVLDKKMLFLHKGFGKVRDVVPAAMPSNGQID